MSLAIQILVIVLLLATIVLLVALFFFVLDLRHNARSASFILRDLEKRLPGILDALEHGSKTFREFSTGLERDFGSIAKILKTALKVLPLGAGIREGKRTLLNKGSIYALGMGLGFGLWEGMKKRFGKGKKEAQE